MKLIKIKKMKMLVILILILGIVISPGCLENKNNEEDSIERTYQYRIKVYDYQGTENYTLYLPFPVDSEGHNEDIFNSLKNQGNITNIEILNRSKGICLKLNHDDNITINLEGELDKFDYVPSMYNHSYENGEENYWVYSSSNDTLHLQIYYQRYSSMGSTSLKKYTAEGEVEEGWQLVEAETENLEG